MNYDIEQVPAFDNAQVMVLALAGALGLAVTVELESAGMLIVSHAPTCATETVVAP
jgi:hypothetical protein